MIKRLRIYLLALLHFAAVLTVGTRAVAADDNDGEVVIASKNFTESVILGEVLAGIVRSTGADARHWRALGGTRILWEALKKGEIDAYVDYTGTLGREILRLDHDPSLDELRQRLHDDERVEILAALSFQNTYAIGLTQAAAARSGAAKVSDLVQWPDLRFGFSHAFMDRQDGWPGLARHYGLPQIPDGIDHDLAYRGIESGDLDGTDVYTTDAEIAYYDLVVLADDKGFFPDYRAIVIARRPFVDARPDIAAAIARLDGQISATEMIAMNRRAKIDGAAESIVAADYLARALGITVPSVDRSWFAGMLRALGEHIFLVLLSLVTAMAVAVPLGIAAARRRRLGHVVLATTGIAQTIPSLAMFVFMIPFFGIGFAPAVIALFIYSLLPIVQNTHAGLAGIPADLRESALALGLPPRARLRLIELPLALPTVLAGIRTAAVINIGTATLAAFIGAGGLGRPILTGIRLDDMGLILSGAIPAALLALGVDRLFAHLMQRASH